MQKNEISLSNDLNIITAEINSYKQVAGQAIFEIGKRLKHVKENDLVHGEFGSWLEKIEMSSTQANRFMKVVSEIDQNKLTHVGQFGFRALYEIATIPQEEREKEHEINGQTKTVDEMTVRELQELKRQNKQLEQSKQQAEQQTEQAEQDKKDAEFKANQREDWWMSATKTIEQLRNQQPETIEKQVIKEIIPEHIKKQMIEKDEVLKSAKNELESMQKEMNHLKTQNKNTDEQTKKEREIKILMLDASKSVLKTKLKIDEFLQEVAATPYRHGAIASSSEGAKQKLQEGVDELKTFCEEMEMSLHGTIEHSK